MEFAHLVRAKFFAQFRGADLRGAQPQYCRRQQLKARPSRVAPGLKVSVRFSTELASCQSRLAAMSWPLRCGSYLPLSRNFQRPSLGELSVRVMGLNFLFPS